MKKFLLFFLLLFTTIVFGQIGAESKARGIFLGFGVGPRLPIGEFSSSSELGYGVNFEISYTDNEYLPFFLFAKAGYEVFPGSQSFYQTSEYSTFSTNAIPVNLGIRYYHKPLLENIILLIPMVEVSVQYNYFQKLHQFKPSSGRPNFNEENGKLGLSIGAGFSMFMMEILGTYNYFQTNQYLAVDLKIRLPLYINL